MKKTIILLKRVFPQHLQEYEWRCDAPFKPLALVVATVAVKITKMNQLHCGELERRNSDSNFPTTLINDNIDDLNYLVTENVYNNSVV